MLFSFHITYEYLPSLHICSYLLRLAFLPSKAVDKLLILLAGNGKSENRN